MLESGRAAFFQKQNRGATGLDRGRAAPLAARALTGFQPFTAATLAVVPGVPPESMALLVGIDRFMSECRALTNLIGNGVATVVISRWESEVTRTQLRAALSANP